MSERFVSGVSAKIALYKYSSFPFLYLEPLFCFIHQTHLALQHGGVYLVIIDKEFTDVTVPHL